MDAADDEDARLSRRSKRSSAAGARGGSGGSGQGGVAFALTKVVPVLLKLEAGFEKLIDHATPLVYKGIETYERLYAELQPYGPDQIIQMLTGLGMMFFGGFFITTVAVIEATDQSGREKLLKNLRKLKGQIDAVRQANDEDDALDEDGDGVQDVKQITQAELGMRKMLVFARACDPNVVAKSFSSMYAILMAVTATLQVKFARTFSLGASIGDVLAKTTLKFVVPPLKEMVPEEFHKWIPPVSQYICRFIGISIAFSVNRILSTVHTAIRGARLATDGFTKWCEARNLHYLSDGYLDDAFAFLLAGIGVFGQLFVWNRLPLLIKLLLFPATFTEWVLSMLVSMQVSLGTSTPQQAGAFSGAKNPLSGGLGAGAPMAPMSAGIPAV